MKFPTPPAGAASKVSAAPETQIISLCALRDEYDLSWADLEARTRKLGEVVKANHIQLIARGQRGCSLEKQFVLEQVAAQITDRRLDILAPFRAGFLIARKVRRVVSTDSRGGRSGVGQGIARVRPAAGPGKRIKKNRKTNTAQEART